MGFLLLLFLCVIALCDQIKSIRKVKIVEKYSRTYLFFVRILAVLFVVWGVFILQDIGFILITILIAIILLLYPYTTGLGKNEIVYLQNIGGFAGLSPKTQRYTDVHNFTIEETEGQLDLVLNIENKFKIKMYFAKEDKEEVQQLLQNLH